MTKIVDNTMPPEGAPINYTLTVTNNGPDTATGIVVTDLLPVDVTFQSATPSQGSYVQASGLWTVGALANGVSATLQIDVQVNAGTSGTTITNTATITASDQSDPDNTDNSDSIDIVPVP
jgi:uncharacterized repeat protein (TIGR01451 family)